MHFLHQQDVLGDVLLSPQKRSVANTISKMDFTLSTFFLALRTLPNTFPTLNIFVLFINFWHTFSENQLNSKEAFLNSPNNSEKVVKNSVPVFYCHCGRIAKKLTQGESQKIS